MLRWIAVLALVAACGCGRSSPAPEVKVSKFQLDTGAGAPRVGVAMAVPPAWHVDPEGPEFVVPGVDGGMISLAALDLKGTDVERMTVAIAMQFGEGERAADEQRRELPGGRVWIERKELRMVHARIFVPYPRGVVMGVALVPHAAAARVDEIRKVFETLTIDGP